MRSPISEKEKELFKQRTENEINQTQSLIDDLRKALTEQNFVPREVEKMNEMIASYENRIGQLKGQLVF
jgi:hypothetical protein